MLICIIPTKILFIPGERRHGYELLFSRQRSSKKVAKLVQLQDEDEDVRTDAGEDHLHLLAT